MKAEHYFLELQNRIQNVSSKADTLFFKDEIKENIPKDLIEDIKVLNLFYLSVFKEPSPILENFLKNIETKVSNDTSEKTNRKNTGSFYTPPYISKYIVKTAIGPLIDKIEESGFEDKVLEISKLTICDPAMGGGIFLVCAQDYVMERMIQFNDDQYTIEEMASMSLKTVYGVDLNADAVEASKLCLKLNTAKWKLLYKFDEWCQL